MARPWLVASANSKDPPVGKDINEEPQLVDVGVQLQFIADPVPCGGDLATDVPAENTHSRDPLRVAVTIVRSPS